MEKFYFVEAIEELGDYPEDGFVVHHLGVFSSLEKAAEAGKAAFEALGEFEVIEFVVDVQHHKKPVQFCKDETEGWYSY